MDKKIELIDNDNLNQLAKLFLKNNKRLYAVGGVVRDGLLDLISNKVDIDICSNVSIQDVKTICECENYIVIIKNEVLQVAEILKDNDRFEYSRLRQESYISGYKHNPSIVEFVDDISIDYLRRDFSINAIYYDIYNKKLIDFCNGVKDLVDCKIKTVCQPQLTLSVDPARILRMLRFALQLDFNIDKQTYQIAKLFLENLSKMSKTRYNKELELIRNSQNVYKNFTPINFERRKKDYFYDFNLI